MEPGYRLFENNDLRREYRPGSSYEAQYGKIVRVEWKPLDAWMIGETIGKDEDVLVITVLLDRTLHHAGDLRSFRFKERDSHEGLLMTLGATTYEGLVGKRVLTHEDKGANPPLRALSHPDLRLERLAQEG